MHRIIRKNGAKGMEGRYVPTLKARHLDPKQVCKPRGGFRAPVGRPPLSPSVHNARIARQLAQDRLTPLHVMSDNLLFFFRDALRLQDDYNQLSDEQKQADLGYAIFRGILHRRLQAQEIAKDMAPYMHPRLNTVAVDGSDKQRPVIIQFGPNDRTV